MEEKKIKDSAIETYDIVHPENSNSYGIAFGGYLMGLLDKAACIVARNHSEGHVTTAGIDNVQFFNPASVGMILQIKASINRVFNSSMEIGVKILGTPLEQTESTLICHGYFTFVALDKKGKPLKLIQAIPLSPEEKRRYEEAIIRKNRKQQLKQELLSKKDK